jgi:amino acid transporter
MTTAAPSPEQAPLDPTGQQGADSGLFLRKATGLVRELSVWDAFNIDLNQTALFTNVGILLPLGLALFAGANLWVSMLTGLMGGLIVVLVYAMLAQVMPRSGGDYVFISRALHPALGFLGTWTMCVLCAFFAGFNMYSLGNWILPDLFAPLATLTGVHFFQTLATNVAKPAGVIAIGAVGLTYVFWTFVRGAKSAARAQLIPAVLTLVAVVGLVPVLLFTSSGTYLHHFNAFASHYGTSAARIEAIARHNGGNLSPHFSLSETVAFWPWVMVIFGYAINSIQIGGEIRNPRRSQYIATLSATVISGGSVALFMALGTARVPSQLVNALGYLQYNAPQANPLPFPIYGHVPLILGGPSFISSLLLIIISLSILLGLVAATMGLWFWGTRYLLAWSLDRVAPPQVATLSRRHNAPIGGILVMAVATVGFALMLQYDTAFTFVAGGLLQSCLLFLAMLAGIATPYRLKAAFASTQPRMIGRVPLIVMLGGVGAVFMAVMVAFYAGNAKFGTVTGTSLWFTIIVVAIGLIYYASVWIAQRRRGVDLSRTYKELPPE